LYFLSSKAASSFANIVAASNSSLATFIFNSFSAAILDVLVSSFTFSISAASASKAFCSANASLLAPVTSAVMLFCLVSLAVSKSIKVALNCASSSKSSLVELAKAFSAILACSLSLEFAISFKCYSLFYLTSFYKCFYSFFYTNR